MLGRTGSATRAIAVFTAVALAACATTQPGTRAVALKDIEAGKESLTNVYLYCLEPTTGLWDVYRVVRVRHPDIQAFLVGVTTEPGTLTKPLEQQRGFMRIPVERYSEFRVATQTTDTTATVLTTVVVVVGILAAVVLVALLIAILTKTSCPLVFVEDEHGLKLVGEAYGGATGFATARDDLLPLPPLAPGERRLVLSNEARETQFTDRLELILVEHSPALRAVSTRDGTAILVGPRRAPLRAADLQGADALAKLTESDGQVWQSDLDQAVASSNPPLREGIVATFAPAARGATAVLEIDAGNTPWLDIVFGRVFAAWGDQIAESHRRGDDPANAAALWAWRQREGVDLLVEIRDRGEWRKVAVVPTPGPMAMRQIAVPLPSISEPQLEVRLSGGIGFWKMDSVAFSELSADVPTVRRLAPAHAVHSSGEDVRAVFAATDGRPQVLAEAGERVEMRFEVPEVPPGVARDAFLGTHGWYKVHRPPQAKRDTALLIQFRDRPGAVAEFGLELWRDYQRSAQSAPGGASR